MIFSDLDSLQSFLTPARTNGQKIITTGGCFDILHLGHIETFRQARAMGDLLIVVVNSDANPYFRTKPGRPINNEYFRLRMLDAIRWIDAVILFDEETPAEIMEIIRPDVHVKGGDYSDKEYPEFTVVKKYGGRVEFVPIVPPYSTTGIVEKVLEIYGPSAVGAYEKRSTNISLPTHQ